MSDRMSAPGGNSGLDILTSSPSAHDPIRSSVGPKPRAAASLLYPPIAVIERTSPDVAEGRAAACPRASAQRGKMASNSCPLSGIRRKAALFELPYVLYFP